MLCALCSVRWTMSPYEYYINIYIHLRFYNNFIFYCNNFLLSWYASFAILLNSFFQILRREFARLTVVQMKSILKKAKEKYSGNKPELLNRLMHVIDLSIQVGTLNHLKRWHQEAIGQVSSSPAGNILPSSSTTTFSSSSTSAANSYSAALTSAPSALTKTFVVLNSNVVISHVSFFFFPFCCKLS